MIRVIRNNRFAACLMCLAMATGVAAPVNAATTEYTYNLSQSMLDNQVINVPMFAPYMGALNNITFSLSTHYDTTTRVENLTTKSKQVGWSATVDSSLCYADGRTVFALPSYGWTFSQTLGAFDGTLDYAGASGVTVADSGDRSGTFLMSLASSLADFTGFGTVGLLARAAETTIFTGGNAGKSQEVLSAMGVTFGVSYDYTVPEPMTIMGVFAGLGSISVYVRRRVRETFLASL